MELLYILVTDKRQSKEAARGPCTSDSPELQKNFAKSRKRAKVIFHFICAFGNHLELIFG